MNDRDAGAADAGSKINQQRESVVGEKPPKPPELEIRGRLGHREYDLRTRAPSR
ncbi:hypothetical protein [Neorhizobium sp. SHOUNA12B]|nr:hypothetical protein [Neorhizobium sp. SHOUNA12B]MCJ9746284.1 hypothetical protein [Neorhizobium sp. SHOUNA12A]